MQIPNERIAIMLAVQELAEIFGYSDLAEDTKFEVRTNDGCVWEAVVSMAPSNFVMAWRRSGSVSSVAGAIHELETARSSFPYDVLPLLVVPYMGRAGQERCTRARMNWMDLSGNAEFSASGIFYHDLGNPNRFRRSGRPESAFGPRGCRITRRLLTDPSKAVTQRTLASSTGLNEGHTSRIVGKLLETGLVKRGGEGIRVVDADVLLDAWQEDYRFDRHHVIRGRIPAPGGDTLVHSLAEALSKAEEPYAATALPAAWLWTRYGSFNLCTLYISRPPSPGLRKDLGFQEEADGANTWLVVPNDEGVFHGAEIVDGIRCVHPVQAYVDLKDHPERAPEAASEIRRHLGLGIPDDV